MLRQNCLNKGIVMPRYNNKIVYQESILLPMYNRFIENQTNIKMPMRDCIPYTIKKLLDDVT